ncbi:hypothetical protein R70723_03820 [Paenibacillus sp. FSL R7-0273]|nr:hypothetical protein R70723_03820 [Paenibacillus sp. FSL R7-0273]OMF86640.1 hypothetical protein BK144_25875 [Paenibacillus sp. FSL R7-0273]
MQTKGRNSVEPRIFSRRTRTDRAIWAIPAIQFQLEHYSKRTWIQGILQRTEKPEQAFRNWMERYFGFEQPGSG